MSQLHYERGGWPGTPWSLSPLASIGSDKGQQSLSPGTLVLLAGSVGLMVTQATKFEKKQGLDCRKMPIKLHQWTKQISVVIRYKLPAWLDVGTHQSISWLALGNYRRLISDAYLLEFIV